MNRVVAAAAAMLLSLDVTAWAQAAQAAPAPASEVRSRFTVSVPRNDAMLFVEGSPADPVGWERVVETGPLVPGRAYTYTFVVSWRPNNYTALTRTRTVSFTAGDDLQVDLTRDEGNDRAQVRYVPTPEVVASAMVRLAKVTRDDVVFEPGCGDARLTIAAVRAGAKKGVGIDLDAARVAEARARVEAAGLADRIEIRQGDALDIKDLADATVVLLYMGDEFDMLIRPILWRQLRVGARVVSHRFAMGDWKPDKTLDVDVEGHYPIHLWTITRAVKRSAQRLEAAGREEPRRR
jgi:uncharacterized protein (TIGR03000 family)